jgi:hypothetical protein
LNIGNRGKFEEREVIRMRERERKREREMGKN